MQFMMLDEKVIDEIRQNQALILYFLKVNKNNSNEKYISRDRAAELFECDKQTIANFEKEGLIERYGRGRLIRYSLIEIKKAMGIKV